MVLLVLALGASSQALAQEPDGAAQLDATKLGVSLERIGRELAATETRESRNDHGLKLSYRVEVFGRAPAIDILGDFNVRSGAVPGSAPSHQDVLDLLTPQAFRSPVIPFSKLAFWAAERLGERSRKQRCEDELSRYRAQVLAGMNVSPPTCAQ